MDRFEDYERQDRLESLKEKEIEELLNEATDVYEDAILLEADIIRFLPASHPALSGLKDYCRNLKQYIKRSGKNFEKAQDERGQTSVNGRLSLRELKRRRDNCDKRIIYLEDHWSRKSQPPKGAA